MQWRLLRFGSSRGHEGFEMRRQRAARITALEGEMHALRAEFNTARRLDEIANRLDRLEVAPRGSAGLRAV